MGPWKESSANPLLVLMFLPATQHSGALRLTPHMYHTWDLSVREDLGNEFLKEVKARIRQKNHPYLGFSLYTWPWVKCYGLPRLLDFSIQTETRRILVSFVRVPLNEGSVKLNLGFSKTAALEEDGLLVQVLTGLAGVSSRNPRLPAPQTDAEVATAWSSSGKV